jgi:general stress protein 26
MLTTRSPNGLLHSRAMSAAGTDGLVFSFIANTDSGKFDDLTHDEQVNISWSSPSSTNWASAAGKASVMKDAEHIKPLWNPMVKSVSALL